MVSFSSLSAFRDRVVSAQVRAARSGSNVVAHEKQRLRLQMKLENVERIKRIAEYRRLETLRKIHEGDRRIQEMIERRERTVQTRKANAIVVKRKKDRLMEVMEAYGQSNRFLQDES